MRVRNTQMEYQMKTPAWHYFCIVPGDTQLWNEQTCDEGEFANRRAFLAAEYYYDVVINTERFVVYQLIGKPELHFYIREDLLA